MTDDILSKGMKNILVLIKRIHNIDMQAILKWMSIKWQLFMSINYLLFFDDSLYSVMISGSQCHNCTFRCSKLQKRISK